MKKLLLLLILFFSSVTMYAEGKKVLSVLMNDGTSVYFLLAEKPLITFQNDEVKIVSDKDEATMKRTLVERFEFVSEIPTGIEDVEDLEEKVACENFELAGDAVYISGLTPGCKVQLLSVNGQVLASEVAGENGCVTLQLEALPSGIYLVNYYETTIKFIKS